MSEYQYYEFRAIDRLLTDQEMRTLRSYSTRAEITPTRFINHYDWGDFKGNVDAWMDEYFDAFLYFANWGTRTLKLRLPSEVLSRETLEQYCPGEYFSMRVKAGNVILSFWSEDEAHEHEFYVGDGCLSSVALVRAELAGGDLRALYLGWLLDVQAGEVDDNEIEPPVPPGLGELSPALHGLAGFLDIDDDLLAAAAQKSEALEDETEDRAALTAWVAALDTGEKDEMLATLMRGERPHLGGELLARFRREHQPIAPGNTFGRDSRRAAGELWRIVEERRYKARRKAAEERARRENEAKAARLTYIDGLAGREPELWAKVERLVVTRQPAKYGEALTLLSDLRDVAERKGQGDFPARLRALRAKHVRKSALLARLSKAGL